MTVKKSEITFQKIRDVKSPSRAYSSDAGIDFFVPVFDSLFIKDLRKKNPHLFLTSTSNLTSHGTLVMYSGSQLASNSEIKYDLSDENNSFVKFDEIEGLNYFLLHPHNRVLIPSGIKCVMNSLDRALIAANKSGVSSKHGLIFSAQVVDSTYTGEIHIGIINTSTKSVRIYENMKLIQFIETPVIISKIVISENNEEFCKKQKELYNESIKGEKANKEETTRGDSGFGSSENK